MWAIRTTGVNMKVISTVLLLPMMLAACTTANRPFVAAIEDAKRNNTAKLAHWFQADGDDTQCEGQWGPQFAEINNFTPDVRVNTDNRSGGCFQRFSVIDPNDLLAGLDIRMEFGPVGADTGECESTFGIPATIKLTRVKDVPGWTAQIRINTDDRPEQGCYQKWTFVDGPPGYAFDIAYRADGDLGQCGNTTGSYHRIKKGDSVTIVFNTDGRPGGCWLRYRLATYQP